MTAGYVVGIDLGTTNCAVAYADLKDEKAPVREFAVAQVVAQGEVQALRALPSFLLLPEAHEVKPQAMALPWDPAPEGTVGTFARERGGELPHRLVSSAKSWLCHGEVDRQKALLPFRGAGDDDEGGKRISPVAASARYLAHIVAAWNHEMPVRLEDQDVLLTVPASFDAVARDLTVLAARQTGLEHVTLLEEPQAAFYAWLSHVGDSWRQKLRAGDLCLVCDLGGGTSDFTLIAATDDGAGNLELTRVAVGDHILLGGDNMDLALAQLALTRLGDAGKKLSSSQYRALVHACHRAKELLLSEEALSDVTISILGGGSKVIGGALKTKIERLEVEKLLIDGFFPRAELDDRPKARRALGLRELGLPYAADPAVTRHLAAFLGRQDGTPTAVLYNGGVMKSALLRRRIDQMLAEWYPEKAVTPLTGTDLDLAVAHGAAYYGLVRRGRGIRIRGGTARAYYIGIEGSMPAIPGLAPPIKAMCIAPVGMEEGSSVEIKEAELGLLVGEATVFRFFASSARQSDVAGTVVDPEDGLLEIAPLEADLPAHDGGRVGDVIAVTLSAHVTAVGTLEIWATGENGARWKLEYSVRESE